MGLPYLRLDPLNPLGIVGILGVGVIGAGVMAVNKYKKSQQPENISGINRLFYGCKNLNHIKMNTNFKEISELNNTDAFVGIPEFGSFIFNMDYKCDSILNKLPFGWNKNCEEYIC